MTTKLDQIKERLSPKEFEVAELFASGMTTIDIATKCGNSHSRIKNIIQEIYGKLSVLGIFDRSALVRAFYSPPDRTNS